MSRHFVVFVSVLFCLSMSFFDLKEGVGLEEDFKPLFSPLFSEEEGGGFFHKGIHKGIGEEWVQRGDPRQVERALKLTRSKRREIQEALIGLGYSVGGVDGFFESRTRSAISSWQREKEFAETGYLNCEQVNFLLNPVLANCVENAETEEEGLGLSLEERRDIERVLSRSHSPGELDGAFDADTRNAIRRWQEDEGESASGFLNANQARKLLESVIPVESCERENFYLYVSDKGKMEELVSQTGKGCDLRGEDFIGENFREYDFRDSDLSGANLSESDLSYGNFSGVNFTGANLEAVTFEGSDLSGAIFHRANMEGVYFKDSVVKGADMRWTNLRDSDVFARGEEVRESFLESEAMNWSGLDLSGLSLIGMDLSGAILRGVNLSGVNLSDSNLSGVDLRGSFLLGTNLEGSDLSSSRLERSYMMSTRFRGSNLSEARFFGSERVDVSFEGTNFNEAQLEDPVLKSLEEAETALVAEQRKREEAERALGESEESLKAERKGREEVERALGEERSIRETMEVQLALEELGYFVGEIDGLLGQKMMSEIENWQREKGFETSGSLSLNERSQLLEEAKEAREFASGLGFKFIKISSGSFMMGSPSSEVGRDSDERQHRVTLTRDFEMQSTEVTQAQWYETMGENPSQFKESSHCPDEHRVVYSVELCPNHPVEKVSWNDVQGFLTRLNERLEWDSYEYRLPTEAEWEYAARAGTATAYSFGRNAGDLGRYGWYGWWDRSGNSEGRTHRVAGLGANPWGLYDMHGNVWEWVEDRYSDYSSGAVTDPLVTGRSRRVLRGGGWYSDGRNLRSAFRYYNSPDYRGSDLGFRLLRTKK